MTLSDSRDCAPGADASVADSASEHALDPASYGATADALRRADAGRLAQALCASRRETLERFSQTAHALAAQQLRVPYDPHLNPPLWELGHLSWFQEYWLRRNAQRARGAGCPADAQRAPSVLADADRLYDSSRVAHQSRWSLPLPDAVGTLAYAASSLQASLELLAQAPTEVPTDASGACYFAWLALMHEDMHGEAASYMANTLGIALRAGRPAPWPEVPVPAAVDLAAGPFALGAAADGFAFDNEWPAHTVRLDACRMDATPVSNADYAAFVEAGAYDVAAYWSAAGWAWRVAYGRQAPRTWRRTGTRWQQCWFGVWEDLVPQAPVCNVSFYEAQAWCAWAGRQLPTEAQWEAAAVRAAGRFCWGQVWEWTASPFLPYPGFVAHPYRDYSQPWFGTRQVLRGASFATSPRLRHPRYRNFFPPERDDIFAGFRSCTPGPGA